MGKMQDSFDLVQIQYLVSFLTVVMHILLTATNKLMKRLLPFDIMGILAYIECLVKWPNNAKSTRSIKQLCSFCPDHDFRNNRCFPQHILLANVTLYMACLFNNWKVYSWHHIWKYYLSDNKYLVNTLTLY
jgi:hypothetical protein